MIWSLCIGKDLKSETFIYYLQHRILGYSNSNNFDLKNMLGSLSYALDVQTFTRKKFDEVKNSGNE